jgi:hypothetical protein
MDLKRRFETELICTIAFISGVYTNRPADNKSVKLALDQPYSEQFRRFAPET